MSMDPTTHGMTQARAFVMNIRAVVEFEVAASVLRKAGLGHLAAEMQARGNVARNQAIRDEKRIAGLLMDERNREAQQVENREAAERLREQAAWGGGAKVPTDLDTTRLVPRMTAAAPPADAPKLEFPE